MSCHPIRCPVHKFSSLTILLNLLFSVLHFHSLVVYTIILTDHQHYVTCLIALLVNLYQNINYTHCSSIQITSFLFEHYTYYFCCIGHYAVLSVFSAFILVLQFSADRLVLVKCSTLSHNGKTWRMTSLMNLAH